jgi:sortase B
MSHASILMTSEGDFPSEMSLKFLENRGVIMQGKVKNCWKIIKRIIICLDLIIFIIALTFCITKSYGYYSDRRNYKKVQAMYKAQENKIYKNNETEVMGEVENKESIESNYKLNLPLVKEIKVKTPEEVYASFKQLLNTNRETIGYIKINNTHINYPVTIHEDNDYYLHRDFQKKTSDAGCIFMDYRNKIKPLDRNIILYGHNMKDMSMFRDLRLYENRDFFFNNDKIFFNTLYQESEYQVFSVYIAEPSLDYIIIDFANDKKYTNYIKSIKTRSLYKKELSVGVTDHILTLSTCSYESPDARLVVHAKLIGNLK